MIIMIISNWKITGFIQKKYCEEFSIWKNIFILMSTGCPKKKWDLCLNAHNTPCKWTTDKSRVSFGKFRKFPFVWAKGPYTHVINVRGGASYFDILYHLSFIYIHKISILEVFIVGIAVDENYVRKQKAPLFTIYTHFQRCLLMKRICQITTATSFYNIYTFSEVLTVELLFVRTQK